MNSKASQFGRNTRTPDLECVRVGPVASIPSLLRVHASESPERILSEIGLDLALFEDPENSISFVKAGQLLELCAKRTGIPYFGLLVGQHADPSALGRLSEFVIYSPDPGTALQNMILHLCIHDRGGIPTLTTSNGYATMEYTTYLPLQGGASQILMLSITNICKVMRAMCGEAWSPSQVLFTHAQPDDTHPYTSIFNAPLNFNSDINALTFPEHWLKMPIPSADVEKYNALVEEMTVMKSYMNIDLVEQIRALLPPLIISGNSSEEHLAHVLSVHCRTLNRRLKARNTTFRSLAADARYEISKQLLEQSTNSILGISTILGYNDASIFTRAFQRWSGMTPSAWRSQYSE